MPSCSQCNKTQSRLNVGDLCKTCNNANTTNQLNEDTNLLTEIDLKKPLSELLVEDLINIINSAMTPISKRINKIEDNLKDLRVDIENNETEIELLKRVIKEQQKAIDGFHKTNRENNLLISGVSYQDGEILIDKVKLILKQLGLENSDVIDDINDVYRIGKKVAIDDGADNDDKRKIMLKFKSKGTKFKILHCTKLLKGWKENKERVLGGGNIFINHDESPMTRKENYRLRNERNRLRQLSENKDKQVIIYQGKLKIDNKVYDEFNIENQLLGKNL